MIEAEEIENDARVDGIEVLLTSRRGRGAMLSSLIESALKECRHQRVAYREGNCSRAKWSLFRLQSPRLRHGSGSLTPAHLKAAAAHLPGEGGKNVS